MGVRAAVTRGDPWTHGHVNSQKEFDFLFDFYDLDNEMVEFDYLRLNIDKNSARVFYKDHHPYSHEIRRWNPQNILALVYIYQYLRKSLGSNIRYPCNPDPGGVVTAPDGPGCVMCLPINPSLEPSSDFAHFDNLYPSNFNWTGIRCSYIPNSKIFELGRNLLGIFTDTSSLKIERAVFYEVPDN